MTATKPSNFKIGQEVIVTTKQIPEKKGTIRFIGKIDGKADQYFGIELDEPCGKNSGDVEGKFYFNTTKKADKGLFGVFVKSISIRLVEVKKGGPSTRPSTKPNAPPPTGKNKLSNQLMEQQISETQVVKEELQAAYEKIKQLQELDAVKEIESLKGRLKQYEEINRGLKHQMEQVKYKSDSNQEQKLKELAERLQFFKNQKESGEREKAELKKKIERLESELEEGADREQMLEKLTIKIDTLQAKNDKLKSDLQAANTQLKSTQVLGTGGKGNEQLQKELLTLSEMVTLLESDLAEEKQKNQRLQAEMQSNSGRLNELVKLERKLKNKEEEIQTMKIELQAYSDAASFVEKLTLDLISKEDVLRDQTKRLKQFSDQVSRLQSQNVESHEMITLQTQQMENLDDEIQKRVNEKEELQKHIAMLNDQIGKYKQKIRELSDNNSSLMMNIEEKDEDTMKIDFNTDIYQHKYYQLTKLHQLTQQNFLQYQLDMSTVRQYAGVFLSNLYDTLPENFVQRLSPNLINLLLRLVSINHKLYLLFQVCSHTMTHKSDMYTAEQENVAEWFLMLLDQIPELYSSLLLIELAITSAESEEDIAAIMSHSELKDFITRIDIFTMELLHKINTETIDVGVSIDPFIEPIQLLDELSLSVKRLPTELATRHQLSVQTMRGVQQLLSSIEVYRRNSQARETAQVDILLQNFLKLLQTYLRECCMNPHIRLKSDMKNYLSGVNLIIQILKEIELNDELQELNCLYSKTEDIKMLKQTIMTTQFHLKELCSDLEQITYPTPLSRIHVKLPGKYWQEKLKSMREELGKFEATLKEKEELEQLSAEQKKKILVLEKEIRDRQTIKEQHERRIGQLQLKVEQAAFLENDFRRQTEKLRSLEEAGKILEEELSSQNKRKKEIEEELRKTKEKFDIFQTETIMKQKKLKSSTSLSTEDLSNLTIFKSVIAEAGALRNHATKEKVHQLKFSIVCSDLHKKVENGSNRRQVLNSLVDCQIGRNNVNVLAKANKAPELQKGIGKQISIGRIGLRDIRQSSLCVDLNIGKLINC